MLLCSIVSYAHDFKVDGIYYNKMSNSTVSVTFMGESSETYLDEYSGDIYIPEGITYDGINYSVTAIDDHAFMKCASLTSVSIPNTVKNINSYAFYSCHSLKSVNIPNSVTGIGICAFYGCSGLTSVIIPENVNYIGSAAFQGCTMLSNIMVANNNSSYDSRDNCNAIINTTSNTLLQGCQNTVIPNSVTSIGTEAFNGCLGLTSVTIPNNITSIGDGAFNGCSNLNSVTIGNSVTNIGNSAFQDCTNLTSITIGNSVKEIGYAVFKNCEKLTNIVLPNSVTNLGHMAFDGCSSLRSVSIPNSITNIELSTFEGCSSLVSVTLGNNVKSIGNRAFKGCTNLVSMSIPNSVTSIGNYTFYDCTGLTSVIIGNNVNKIGDYAFENCITLTSVIVPNSVESIGDYAFRYCKGLKSITIGNNVMSIGNYAFANCTGLTSVSIPNSVESIGNFAFSFCRYLAYVCIGNGIKSIGDTAFNCSGLEKLKCYATIPPELAYDAFVNVNKDICILCVPSDAINEYANSESEWSTFKNITILTDITINDGSETAFTVPENYELDKLTYTRTLPNLYWNALYVPFEIPVSEIIDKYEVAYVNNVNSYDHNDDGTIDDMRMEVIKIKSGTLNANYPYLIKARNEEAKNMTITLENTTLFQSVETTIDCSSVFAKHEITGIYNKRYKNELPEGAMAISMAGAWQPIASDSYLNPFRLYMTITAREGSPVKVEPAAMSRIRISVLGEDVETDIEETRSETKNIILDLSGRSVQNPVKGGVYIVNGKKVIF